MAKRARHDLPEIQEKRALVVELRAQGRTWDQIAAAVGYANGSAASKAWKAAIQQRPDQTVDEIRLQERARLEAMDSRLSDVVSSPPIKTTSIGRTQFDPRTCTCPTKARTERDHEPGCQVQPMAQTRFTCTLTRADQPVCQSYTRSRSWTPRGTAPARVPGTPWQPSTA